MSHNLVKRLLHFQKPYATIAGQLSENLVATHAEDRITESQKHLCWKRPLISLSSPINLTLQSPPLNHVKENDIQLGTNHKM